MSFSQYHFKSSEKQNQLIELYTSQSCSSCPPAEKWLSSFNSSKFTWDRIFPVSYHVSYWNHLHWKDKFSQQNFSNRQRRLSKKISSGVYTPQVVLNGRDYRSWRSEKVSLSDKKVGQLSIQISREGVINLDFKGNVPKNSQCFFAFLKNEQTTKINSGENQGKTLVENFIISSLKTTKISKQKCQIQMPSSEIKDHYAITAWIADQNFQVIQVVGGRLKKY